MPPYRDYTQAVCSCLRHATSEEKQAVAQELQDHLADHADALVEAGWDPEEAQAHALAAMGEAQEVGLPSSVAHPLPGAAGSGGAGGHRPPAPHPRPVGQRLEQPSGPG